MTTTPPSEETPPPGVTPIEEIAAALRLAGRLVDELPGSPHTSRLSVAIEGAQGAAAAHPSRKLSA